MLTDSLGSDHLLTDRLPSLTHRVLYCVLRGVGVHLRTCRYERGAGVPQDDALALRYYRLSAEKGHPKVSESRTVQLVLLKTFLRSCTLSKPLTRPIEWLI